MVYINGSYLDEMIAHAQEEAPYEACGVLAGANGRPTKVYRARSAERSPVRYHIEPHDQLRIMREIEENGWEILGIYHSHPNGPDHPSATDVALAFYPEAIYVIVSLRHPERPQVRAFRIIDGQIAEERLETLQ